LNHKDHEEHEDIHQKIKILLLFLLVFFVIFVVFVQFLPLPEFPLSDPVMGFPMQLSAIGLTLDEIDTPALLLDLDAMERNIATMSGRIQARGLAWRPHAKAFKCPAIAQKLRRSGAIGVTVAKVSEAEVMAAGGIDDILIAHLVVGPSKAARLAALQRQADVKVTVDDPAHIPSLDAAAIRAGVRIGVLIDVDLGMKRCGVASPAAAVALARQVAAAKGLRFDGVMGYEGHTLMIEDADEKRDAIATAIGRLIAARSAVEDAGFPCRIVSAGGTGSYQITSEIPGLTELQAGGGIFACNYYTHVCHVTGHIPSLTVLTTVISRPAPDRLILDAGRKALSDYRVNPNLPEYPDCQVLGLSAEHTTVAIEPGTPLKIGDKVSLIPGYSDFTFVLHNRVLGFRAGRIEVAWDLLGRGLLQ
jgi:D-serine deaminase-like pyridoxal phosphate-dependent protein